MQKSGESRDRAPGSSVSAMVSRKASCCINCGEEPTFAKRRDFSAQAYTLLLLWEEMSPEAVHQPMCDNCYHELRDVLIERRDEVDAAMNQPEMPGLDGLHSVAS